MLKEAEIRKKEINIIVWLLPIISLIVAIWLIYKYYSSLGPVIDIYFKNSGGLEPQKSFVRFRDVKVGVVEKVILLKDKVLVKVRVHKDIEPFLNNSTKFWVVKPTIEVGKIRGLEALLSGPFIQMYAKAGNFSRKVFEGLNEPPLDSDILNGKIIKLVANSSYGLKEKMPVYYKDIKVGTIRKVVLKENRVYIYVSIKKQYAKYVNDTTKFWNLRGIDVNLNKDNLKVEIPSLGELLIGGVVFETLDMNASNTKDSFILYSSRSEAFDNKLGDRVDYVDGILIVKNDVNSKLRVGNPIIFKGFKVGYISYIKSKLDLKNLDVISYCDIKINVDAFRGLDSFKKLLKKGLVAEIVRNNLLFDSYKIDLVFKNRENRIKVIDKKIVIPLIKSKRVSIADKISKILDKLSKVDYVGISNSLKNFIDKNSNSLNKLVVTASATLNDLDSILKSNEVKKLPKNLNLTLKNIQSLTKTYSKNSMFYIKLDELLKEVDKSIKLFKKIEKKIDNKPNSLIFGD